MTTTEITRTHGDERSRSFTYCNVACPRCDQLMAERAIEVKAAQFATAWGKPGSRAWIQARADIIAAALERLDAAKKFEPNESFNKAFDAGKVTWVNDVAVR